MAAAAGVPLIGGVIGGVGSMMEAHDASDAYKYEAQQYEYNAQVTRSIGKYNAARQEMHAGKVIGSMKAANAASGIASDSGSVLDVLAASRVNAEMDRMSILHESEFRAAGLEERARYDRTAADKAIMMGYFNAFSSIFQGGAKSLSMAGGGASRGGGSPGTASYSGANMAGGAGDDRYDDTGGYGIARPTTGPSYFGRNGEYV